MFRLQGRTPFLEAVDEIVAYQKSPPFSGTLDPVLDVAANRLAEAEPECGVAFVVARPDHVNEAQVRESTVTERLRRFLDATCLLLDGHTAQLFDVVFEHSVVDDFMTARAWGGHVAAWMNARHPKPDGRWRYMDFYVASETSRVIESYDAYARAFVMVIERKAQRRAIGHRR